MLLAAILAALSVIAFDLHRLAAFVYTPLKQSQQVVNGMPAPWKTHEQVVQENEREIRREKEYREAYAEAERRVARERAAHATK